MAQSNGSIEGSFRPVTPLHQMVVVQPSEAPDFQGKLIIPDNCKSMFPTTGMVISISSYLNDPESGCELEEGDIVLYSKYSGLEVSFSDKKKVVLLNYEDIKAIISPSVKVVGEVE